MVKIAIKPMGAKRVNYKATWAPEVQRYFAYCNELRLKYRGYLSERVHLIFFMPMPISWSQKKRLVMDDKPHQQTPDIDNLVKGVLDSLARPGIKGKPEDSYIYRVHASKYWAKEGAIEIIEL